MNIWKAWKNQIAREQSAAWHTRISRGLTESQRRRFEVWIAELPNAREFSAQRVILDEVLKTGKLPETVRFASVSAAAPVKLAKPPAIEFVSALKWILTESAYTRIVAPLVAQEQHEYYEAVRSGDMTRARWIEVRMYALIAYSVLFAVLLPIAKLFRRVI